MTSNILPMFPQEPTPQTAPLQGTIAPALAHKYGRPMAPEAQAAFDAADEQNLRASWGAALEVDPKMRADAENHARALGQPVESVAENMDIARRMVKERQLQYQELRARYPAMLDRFSDVKFAAVAHDDIGNLKLTEGAFDWWKRNWTAGMLSNDYGYLGAKWAAGMASTEEIRRIRKMEMTGQMAGDEGWGASVLQVVAQMAGTVPYAIGAGTAAAGSAALISGPGGAVTAPSAFAYTAGATIFAQSALIEGGSAYAGMRAAGYSHESSQMASLGVGIINGALEVAGAEFVAAPFKKALLRNATKTIAEGLAEKTAGKAFATFGKEYLKGLAGETATEVMQEFVTMAGERIARESSRPDQSPMTWGDIGSRVGDVFVKTVQAMSVLAAPGPGMHYVSDSIRANEAMRGKDLLEKLVKGADATALAKNSPDRYRQFIAKAAEGTDAQEMFIEPDRLREVLAQTGVSVEQLGEVAPEVAAQLEQSDADGGPVAIATDLFAAKLARTDVGKAMVPHVKFSETGFTVAQGEAFQKDGPKMAEQAAAEFEKSDADMKAVRESTQQVQAGMRAQLVATGKFDGKSADAVAGYYGSFVALQAARAKMMPAEFAAKYPLKVVAGEAQTGALRQPSVSFEDIQKQIAERKSSADRLAASGGSTQLFGADGRYAIAGPDMSKPGAFRITRFDAKGPVGHTEFDSLRGAIYDGLSNGYREAPTGSVVKQDGSAKTDTPEFRAWFDGSAVVDEKGAPLVVYHGSRKGGDFEQFRMPSGRGLVGAVGAHFGDETQAKEFGGSRSFWLAIKNPLRMEDAGGWFVRDPLFDYVRQAGVDVSESEQFSVLGSDDPIAAFRLLLESKGYDGIVYANEVEGHFKDGVYRGEADSYIAFRPEQIKSVNNSGAFDPTNPNILKQTTKGTFDPASLTITLTKDADSSTALHEFGHAFLTMMADLAAQPDAPVETVADVQTVLDWFGVKDVATWNAMTLAEQTPHHEAFARSFEVYLFDGKAPSKELEGVFRKFARWVRAAYKSIRDGINAAYRAEFGRDLPFLTPEVRGVFDRMVASEEAISRAEAIRDMTAMFSTEEEFNKANPEAGPDGWAKYQAAVAEAHELAVEDLTQASLRQMKWLTGAKSRLLKAMQREGKATRANVEAEESVKVLSEPVYQVGTWLARGEVTHADGTVEVEPGNDHKLDLEEVKALVGIKVKVKAPKKVKVAADTEKAKQERKDRLLAAAKNKPKSMVTRMRELGGISRHSWETSYPGERKGEFKIKGVVRGQNDGTKAFRTVGIPWENMAQILRSEGYGPQDQDPSDFSWFVDAVTDAAAGVPTYREYDYIQRSAVEADARASESAEERKARLADEKEAMDERDAIRNADSYQPSIDPWDLNAASPEDALDRLGTGKYGMLRKGGLPADEIARIFKFENGERMVVALLNAKKPEAIIAERTDARMLAEHGNLVSGSEEQQDAIEEALHNEARARFVATEWAHLAKAGQPVNEVRRALRASAQRQLADMATGRIAPHKFALAEANAARESMRASKAGKFDEALAWKRKQLLQGELAKQAIKVRAEIEKGQEDLKVFARADAKVAETRNLDLVNAGRVLAAAYGLGRPPETAQQAAIVKQALIDTLRQHPVIGGQLQALLADGVADWKQVPLSRFRDVAEIGRALWDLARRVNEVDANGRKVAMAEVSEELRSQIATLPDRAKSAKAPGGETVSGTSRWIIKGWNAVASLKRMEHWARFMDGGKADGPFTRYMVHPVMRALQSYRTAKAGIIGQMHPKLLALAKDAGKAWDAKIDAPELGFTFRGIKEVIGAMLHTGSDSNLFKLLGDKVRKWCPVVIDPTTGEKTVITKNWDDFLRRMHAEGRITQAHWDYVRFVWAAYAKTLPEAQKTHKALYGREFATIELRKVETPFGTFEGGYVPATTDRDEVSTPRPSESIDGIDGMEQNFEWDVSTGKGFTIERNPNYAQPLVLNVARQLVGFDASLRFIHLQPTIRDVLRISRERQFGDALASYDRDARNSIITPWLENTATQATSRPSDIPLVDKLATLLRRGTSLAALGLNFFNALIQVTGISNARAEVKGRYMRSAMGTWLRNPVKAFQEAALRSTYFKQRMDTKTHAMTQDIARMGDPGIFPGLKLAQDRLGKAAFFPQRIMQGIADTVTWHAAYAQAYAEGNFGDLLTSEEREQMAVERADGVLRRVQGSLNPEDLAAYEAGTPLAKLFTQFGSYSNIVLNQLMGASKGKKLQVALWALVMPALIESTMRAFLAGKVDKDDDDQYLDDLAALYGKNLLRNAVGLIPGAGPLVLSLAESEGSRLAATPAGTSLQSAVQGAFAVSNLVQGEDMTSYQIRNLGTLLTILSGLPLSPISRALGYQADVRDGKAQPTGPIDYARGLVTGQR